MQRYAVRRIIGLFAAKYAEIRLFFRRSQPCQWWDDSQSCHHFAPLRYRTYIFTSPDVNVYVPNPADYVPKSGDCVGGRKRLRSGPKRLGCFAKRLRLRM
jgi:hypothetical protein